MRLSDLRALVLAALLAVTLLAGCARSQAGVPTERPTPPPSTPNAEDRVEDYDDALRTALPLITGQGSIVTLHEMTSVSYVQTTFGRAQEATGEAARSDSTLDPATPTWLFVAYGRFQESANGRRGKIYSAVFQTIPKGQGYVIGGLTSQRYDLSQLGDEHVIQPGEVPELDAVRVPANHGVEP